MTAPALPPGADRDSAGFWAALARGELLVAHCRSCDRRSFPPIPSCPSCGSADVEAVRDPGLGRVYSWVTVHLSLDPAFAGEVPYTVVAVDLDGGGRILGRLLDDGAPTDGAPVRLEPYPAGGVTLPGFRFSQTPDERPVA